MGLTISCPKSEKGGIRQEGRNMKDHKNRTTVFDLGGVLIFTLLLVGVLLFF